MGIGVPPFDEAGCEPTDDTDEEYQALPEDLKREIDAAWELGVASFAGKPCIWLDAATKRCKHYEWRPVVCAEFVPGPENWVCVEDRARFCLGEETLEGEE
jgi:Fe-S-cluster containining protein